MKSVLETVQSGTGYLEARSVDEARLNMEYLVAKVLECERLQLYMDFDRPLDEEHLAPLRDLVKRRGAGEPLQHLLGTVEFAGNEFTSDSRGLIPRPETEELVEMLVGIVEESETGRALDVGCGSGVIGLSLAHALGEGWEITLSDLSDDALALAGGNTEKLGLGERVTQVKGHLLEAAEGTFDLIVANLPYIPRGELAGLQREVQFDPSMALDGGEQGAELMNEFLATVQDKLNPGGLVAMEYGIGQAAELAAAAENVGLVEISIEKDTADIERFLLARKPAS